jgi:hypothetical protein
MVPPDITKDLEQFFSDYNAAFRTIDGRRIAPFYYAPCLTLRGDGSFLLLQSRQEIEDFFEKVADTYKADGYSTGAFTNLTALHSAAVAPSPRWIGNYSGTTARSFVAGANRITCCGRPRAGGSFFPRFMWAD